MPTEVREAQRRYNLRTFGPSGIFEQDDGENWSEIQAISHGFITNRVPLERQREFEHLVSAFLADLL